MYQPPSLLRHVKPRIHERVEWFMNLSLIVLQTRCAYVWTGLRTCAALSVNGLHTICRKPKFFGIFVRTQREQVVPGVLSLHRVSFARLRFA